MWEEIESGYDTPMRAHTASHRLSVPDGWLVRTIVVVGSLEPNVSVNQIHVSDPEHHWSLVKGAAKQAA
ncbi:MAG: hypothetical protein ABA06_04085 [Parcubacteria bacterium C7867-001]|nr:MAG: hypothetical protein ABA06_04085 [Parcubacteria bacterium C7867-001]